MQPPAEGSVILLDVASLVPDQQAELLRWLNEGAGRYDVQLASTSSEPLFPLVEAGAFDATLYYRLNTIRIEWFDSTAGAEQPMARAGTE
jgi:transcriptional regulator of aromatic amino acid metabolism